jgi:dolichol-phosphate mannosyltransferase
MPKILIFIPTLNEKENIRELIARIRRSVGPEITILFIDGGSIDGTQDAVSELSLTDPRIHLQIIDLLPAGRGAADTAGFRYALENNFDFMVQMDADLSHQPEYIPSLLNATNENDIVIGSRFIKGGQIIDRGLARNLLSRCANFYIRLLLGIKIKDSTSGFRCFTKKALSSLNLNKKFSPGPANLIEILYECNKNKLKIKEVPIIFINRKKGRSKLSAWEIVESLKAVLSLRYNKTNS